MTISPLSLVFLPIRKEVFKLWGLVMGKRREGGIKTKKRPFHKDLFFEVSSGVEPLYTVLQTVT